MSEVNYDYIPSGGEVVDDELRHNRILDYHSSDFEQTQNTLMQFIDVVEKIRVLARSTGLFFGPAREPVTDTLMSEIISTRLTFISDTSEILPSTEAQATFSDSASSKGGSVVSLRLATLIDRKSAVPGQVRAYVCTLADSHAASNMPESARTIRVFREGYNDTVWKVNTRSQIDEQEDGGQTEPMFHGIDFSPKPTTPYEVRKISAELEYIGSLIENEMKEK